MQRAASGARLALQTPRYHLGLMTTQLIGFVLAAPLGVIVGFVVGAVTSYLVLRNNPKLKAKADAEVQKIDDKTKF